MKKLFSGILSLALLLALCAVPTAAAPAQSELRVGFGRTCITPQESVSLTGYGTVDFRFSENVLDDLYATAIALTDAEDNTIIMVTIDNIRAAEDVTRNARSLASMMTGVPKDHIMICATHTHSAPETSSTKYEAIWRYYSLLTEQIAFAAYEAMNDRVPAEMYFGRTEIQGLNFVRRYLLNDGEWFGPNYNVGRSKDIVAHESEADHEMQFVRFDRTGAQDILMCNWQAHPTKTGGRAKTDVSADFIGAFRAVIEDETDYLCAYFTGGAGNINPSSNIASENCTSNVKQYGRLMANAFKNMEESDFVKAAPGAVGTVQVQYTAKSYRPDPELEAEARTVSEFWSKTADYNATISLAAPLGIHSPYHANAIISGLTRPETITFEIDALCIGDLAFITAPYEMFDVNGKEIKTQSPFPMTFICSCANGSNSYIPSLEASTHFGYENDVTRVEPGTGDLLRAEFVRMLNGLHG